MKEKQRICVYVAGPMRKGNIAKHVHKAVIIGTQLLEAGFAPMLPQLTHVWDIITPNEVIFEEWIAIDFAWIAKADALLRLPGESEGGDMEVDFAYDHKIPVFNSVASLKDWAKNREVV